MRAYKTTLKAVFCGCALAASLLIVGCGPRGGRGGGISNGSGAVTDSIASPNSGADANFVRTAAAKVEPSVVTVHTLAAIQRQPMSLQDQLYGRGGMEFRHGAGSGVILSADGYILTNNHVVADAQRVTVQVGGTGYAARVIGTDSLTDIAVVKVSPAAGASFPAAQFGDSDTVQVGDWAVAVGDPLDIGTTVTFGIISAIGERGPHLQGDTANTVLQTDAAINPGNSGGALANRDGQVIGINEAIASPIGTFIGISFAIPINAARQVAKQLIAHGRVIQPYLGVSYVPVKTLPPPVRAQAGIDPNLTDGVVIAQVAPDGPAADSLKANDVIISADGQALTDTVRLSKIIAAHQVGDNLSLQVQRAGQTITVQAPLRERPASYGLSAPGRQP